MKTPVDMLVVLGESIDGASQHLKCVRCMCEMHGVLQGMPVNWSAALRAVPLHIVTPSTHFEKVLELLAENSLHRVYVLDDTEHSIGIITLTDILRQLLPMVRSPANVNLSFPER